MYEVSVPIKCATKTGYQMAQVGDSIDLSYLRNRAEAPKDRMPKLPVKIRRKEKVL